MISFFLIFFLYFFIKCGFIKDLKGWEKSVPFNENGTFKDLFEESI
jgi:hypothetical protein